MSEFRTSVWLWRFRRVKRYVGALARSATWRQKWSTTRSTPSVRTTSASAVSSSRWSRVERRSGRAKRRLNVKRSIAASRKWTNLTPKSSRTRLEPFVRQCWGKVRGKDLDVPQVCVKLDRLSFSFYWPLNYYLQKNDKLLLGFELAKYCELL